MVTQTQALSYLLLLRTIVLYYCSSAALLMSGIRLVPRMSIGGVPMVAVSKEAAETIWRVLVTADLE